MRSTLAIALLFSTSALTGCGGSLPPAPSPSKDAPKLGPHQGTAYALPGEQGYVEVVNEPLLEERGSKSPTSLVAYFLGPDAKSAAGSLPTEVQFVRNDPKNKGVVIPLKANPKAEDPAGAGRFASEPGPYQLEDLRGELSAALGGNPIMISIVAGR